MAIAKTQDAINQHKTLLAHSPPPIQHTNLCMGLTRNQYKSAYEELWWKHVGRLLLDPQTPIQCWGIPSVMERIDLVGMGDGCMERTRLWVLDHTVLKADEIIQNTLMKLIAAMA